MNLLKWEFKEFLIKFLVAEGVAIAIMLDMHVTDGWQWAKVAFYGICAALGVDTGTWLAKSAEKAKEDEE